MKMLNKNHLFKFVILFLLLLMYICISAISYATSVSANIADSVFRLHVIANSDSEYDQNLKLKVRDSLLSYMNSISSGATTKLEAIQIASSHLEDFKCIAEDVIKSEGYHYPVNISISKCDFPSKNYGDVSLPSGNYDALRVQIGDATGQNWWCVMFPPLCFVDVSSGIVPDESKEILKDSLGDEEYELITANNSLNNNSTIKFKLIELVEQLKSKI